MSPTFSIIDLWRERCRVVEFQYLPEEMQNIAKDVAEVKSQQEAVRRVYDILAAKYRGYRLLTFLRPDRLFLHTLDDLWGIRGFLHCHHLNYLFRTLLVVSGKFSSADIHTRWTWIWFFSPHQYLEIYLKDGGKIIRVDLWGKAYGIPFGEYAHGFHAGSILHQSDNKVS